MPARVLPACAALVAAVACGAPPAEVTAPSVPAVDVGAVPAPVSREPQGVVRIAYPDEPASLLDVARDDPAAADLAALWGLPLFRVDPAGQLAPGLVRGWEVVDGDGWAVELDLRDGTWSDGRAVVAEDVVATFAALREGPRAAELTPLVAVEPVDDDTVRLRFDLPYARWWALLDGIGVLPAGVLEEDGIGAYASAVPVSGGWFRLTERVPGLRTVFEAHPDGPLGAPGLQRLEVLVVPRYETALAMLRDDEVDGLVGYLALNPVERARRVAGVEAAAPVGGTTVTLGWRPDGSLGGPAATPRRRAMGAAIDVSQLVEGLLGPGGTVATSPVPGMDVPAPRLGPADEVDIGEPIVALPRWPEATGFTARAVQRDLRSAGGGLELRAEPSPHVVTVAREVTDGWIRPVRTGPWPSLVGAITDVEVALAADAGGPGSAAFAEGLARVAEDALVWPLYRMGVAHVWSPRLQGIRPSAWLGLAFWDAGAWSVATG